MKFQKEDRVAFINENQEGIVIRYTASGRVIVAIEEGFELEMGEQELVLIKRKVADPIIEPVATAVTSIHQSESNPWPSGQVSIAFMPSDKAS